LLQRDLKAELSVDTLEGAFPRTTHVVEVKRRWDSLSEKEREASRVRAREVERRYGPGQTVTGLAILRGSSKAAHEGHDGEREGTDRR